MILWNRAPPPLWPVHAWAFQVLWGKLPRYICRSEGSISSESWPSVLCTENIWCDTFSLSALLHKQHPHNSCSTAWPASAFYDTPSLFQWSVLITLFSFLGFLNQTDNWHPSISYLTFFFLKEIRMWEGKVVKAMTNQSNLSFTL